MNYWKIATIVLVGILLWLVHAGHAAAAQYTSTEQTYNITRMAAASGRIKVSGAVVAFSCVSDVRGNLDQGNGLIESSSECYVLSKQRGAQQTHAGLVARLSARDPTRGHRTASTLEPDRLRRCV